LWLMMGGVVGSRLGFGGYVSIGQERGKVGEETARRRPA